MRREREAEAEAVDGQKKGNSKKVRRKADIHQWINVSKKEDSKMRDELKL